MGCCPLKTLKKGVKCEARARAGKPIPRPPPLPKTKIRGPSNKQIHEDYADLLYESGATGHREALKAAAKEGRKSARNKKQKTGTDWNPTQAPTGLFVPSKMEDSAALRRDWRRQKREDRAREREECQRKKHEEEQQKREEEKREEEERKRAQESQEEQPAGFMNLVYRPKPRPSASLANLAYRPKPQGSISGMSL